MNVQAALIIATRTLKDAGIESAARDARKLMAASLGIESDRLTLHLHDDLDAIPEAAFFASIQDRLDRKPVSHLLGWRAFFGRRFIVTPDTLDPRPETETLVEAALELEFTDVLDIGTGTGCILLTLIAERPDSTGIGTDLSPSALAVAERNAKALEVNARCDLIESNWFDSVVGKFDLIVSNPPYIALDEMPSLAPELQYEPRMALTDEGDGLTAYRILSDKAQNHLKPGGAILVEIGWQQGADVSGLFREAGFVDVRVLADLEGRDRVVAARMR